MVTLWFNRFLFATLLPCALALSFLLCIFGGFLAYIRCDNTDICDAADIREPSAALVPFQRH